MLSLVPTNTNGTIPCKKTQHPQYLVFMSSNSKSTFKEIFHQTGMNLQIRCIFSSACLKNIKHIGQVLPVIYAHIAKLSTSVGWKYFVTINRSIVYKLLIFTPCKIKKLLIWTNSHLSY